MKQRVLVDLAKKAQIDRKGKIYTSLSEHNSLWGDCLDTEGAIHHKTIQREYKLRKKKNRYIPAA